MNNSNIQPEKITKPIQLLGAWLVGLFSINSSFLIAAVNLSDVSWIPQVLIIASIVNVPLFLVAVFLLQTKFRPELQEDSYYSDYLSQKTNKPIMIPKSENSTSALIAKVELLESKLIESLTSNSVSNANLLSPLLFGINQHLSDKLILKNKLAELHIHKATSFGAGESVPSARVMSISQYLSNDVVQQLIKLAKDIGMDGYKFFDNMMEETQEDVLIGSYGGIEFEII
ncbi:hypothetical protein PVK64_19725 [Aliivibrio sp. S4TY2]|uniref:hypothetical protein n=1 Tax=unclassified Aliivibrio TaxID=2645654 RepID=UPI0023781BD8|nr:MULTISPECIES: hypothetical protein [unclassified Aliivibrio]MDD9158398.1 hypothetical protein [Aliivibrio sp. S4TY2]MDD9162398.1 hypothetical protein [Aliivibrio sp. S4TY1]MDD9166405.1 hypothetical protein [Aliivibrio sp. S4MY2]MDD9170403.1 hypothetical protein [Aliivibrio sp. S4MY4]MDD9187487.1 hypothetical protein [Aliivibrio sp. S4MY3]